MGELRTRKRGKTWEWSFEGARIGGKRNPISKGGFRTKAEALADGIQAKAEYDNTGKTFKASEASVADYLDFWVANYVEPNLHYLTALNYKSIVENHLKPHFGIYKLSSLEPESVQVEINKIFATGLARPTVVNIKNCLSGALNYAVMPCRYIKTNPCQWAKVPQRPESEFRKKHREYILTEDDFEKIITHFGPSTHYYIPIMTGYHLGTRISETYGIDLLHDVDFKKNLVTIQHQLVRENGHWYYREPKYNSVRTIEMGKTIAAIFKQELIKRRENQLRFGEYFVRTYLKPDNEVIQTSAEVSSDYTEIMPLSAREAGKLLTPKNFGYCATLIHKKLNNPLFHSHSLRHTHGTYLAENGAYPNTVMERMGHKDIATTLNTYVFNTAKLKQSASNILL